MLEMVQDDIWVVRQPFTLAGLDLGTVMTVVRLSSGGLFVHSPVEASPDVCRALDALGPVEVVVSPSLWRTTHVSSFIERYPECTYCYAPGLEHKLRGVFDVAAASTELREDGCYGWQSDLDVLHLAGMPLVNAFVFYHRTSATLIATNLPIAADEEKLSWLFRLGIRNKGLYNAAVDRLQGWPLERVIGARGPLIKSNAARLIPRLMAS